MLRSTVVGVAAVLMLLFAAPARAQPSTNLDDYVLFATTTLKTKGPTISDGDVGVNLFDGRLVAPRFFTAPNSIVAADRVRFDKNPMSTVLQQLFANVIEQFGPPSTPFTTPIIPDVKAACGFPVPFPACATNLDVDVAIGGTVVLPPGVYGRVRVHGTMLSAGNLVLTGGAYVFCDVKISRNAQLRVQTASTIDVVGKASFGPSSFFGPDTGSGLVASDIQLHSAGSLVKLTRDSFSEAHVCAPDAKMRMSQGGTHVGSYIAGFIRTQEVTLDVGSPSGAFVDP
ncbi:MAG TPA: hypothetical protein VMS22_16765 [Candidatus Eisenbacteria bacterium]|nr:hypothetical protein [Candidatus Eisenbacteria bacterium]